MRILVIGGTGFIGRHVVRMLVEHGHEVASLSRSEASSGLPAAVLRIRGDRDAIVETWPTLVRLAPDVVLDVIPYTEREACGLVALLRGTVGRLVVVSSGDVYRNYDGFRGRPTAPPDTVPLAEGAPLCETRFPYRGYGLQFEHADQYDKVLVERAVLGESCATSDPTAVVLRLPAVYGPGDKHHRLRPYLQRMDDGRPAILLAEGQDVWRWTRGYVENVAAAIALAVEKGLGPSRVYNVGDLFEGEPAPTERAWVERVGEAAGWRGEVVVVPGERLPKSLQQPFNWRYDLAIDTTRIRDELRYAEPVPLGEALARTIAWERLQPREGGSPDYEEEDAALDKIGFRGNAI